MNFSPADIPEAPEAPAAEPSSSATPEPAASTVPPTRLQRVRQGSQRRRAQEREALRRLILTAAEALFLELGYEGFSMRLLAERIGYSATTLYLYFEDKDALLFTVVDEGFEAFGRALQEAASSVSEPIQRIQRMGEAFIRFGCEHRAHYLLMFNQRIDFLMKCQDQSGTPRISSFGILQEAVAEAVAVGALIGEPQAISDLLFAMVHGVVSLALGMPFMEGERLEKLTHMATTAWLEGLKSPAYTQNML